MGGGMVKSLARGAGQASRGFKLFIMGDFYVF